MEIAYGVAAGLAGVCVDERGRLIEHPLLDCSVRAALLADLVRAGRLRDGGDAVHIDPAPVGWAALDATVEWLGAGATTLDDWIMEGGPGLRDVVDGLVADGAWSRIDRPYWRRFRYDTGRPRDRWGRTPERRLVQLPGAAPASAKDAAVVLLAWAAGLGYDGRPVDDLLVRTGELGWLCNAAWRAISERRTTELQTARAMRLGRTFGAPG